MRYNYPQALDTDRKLHENIIVPMLTSNDIRKIQTKLIMFSVCGYWQIRSIYKYNIVKHSYIENKATIAVH